MTNSETVLAELPGASDVERVLLVHKVQGSHRQSEIELRQQSWAPGIGWFTQSSVHLSPEQVGSLRIALGSAPTRSFRPADVPGKRVSENQQAVAKKGVAGAPSLLGMPRSSSFVPRIVRAETA
jgi:hypothetical protein